MKFLFAPLVALAAVTAVFGQLTINTPLVVLSFFRTFYSNSLSLVPMSLFVSQSCSLGVEAKVRLLFFTANRPATS
jgi:hypothetical protein